MQTQDTGMGGSSALETTLRKRDAKKDHVQNGALGVSGLIVQNPVGREQRAGRENAHKTGKASLVVLEGQFKERNVIQVEAQIVPNHRADGENGPNGQTAAHLVGEENRQGTGCVWTV